LPLLPLLPLLHVLSLLLLLLLFHQQPNSAQLMPSRSREPAVIADRGLKSLGPQLLGPLARRKHGTDLTVGRETEAYVII
jgi:hypothetical protein